MKAHAVEKQEKQVDKCPIIRVFITWSPDIRVPDALAKSHACFLLFHIFSVFLFEFVRYSNFDLY